MSAPAHPDLPLGVRWPDLVPLGTTRAAAWLLQKEAAEVALLLDDGRLLWGWNLAGADADRRELRVWRPSVDALARGEAQPGDSETAVLAHVLPEGREWFTAVELAKRWMVSRNHVLRLLAAKTLSLVQDSPWRTGAGGSPRVTRRSAADFLRRRRVC